MAMTNISRFFPAALAAMLAGGAMMLGGASVALAQDAPLTIIVRPGQAASDVQQVLDFAARSGRPVAIQVGDGATSSAPVAAAVAPIDNAVPAAAAPASIQTTAVAAPVSASVAAPATPPAPAATAPNQTAATTAAPAPMTPTPEMMATDMGMAKWSQFSAAFLRGASTALSGIRAMPTAMAMGDDQLVAEGSGYGRAFVTALAILAIAGLVTVLVRRIVGRLFSHRHVTPARFSGIVRHSVRRLIGDLLSVALFLGMARLALHFAETAGETTARVAGGAVTAVVFALFYVSLARLLFKENGESRSLVPIRWPRWHFRILVTYGIIGATLSEMARLADSLGVDRLTIDGWFLTATTLLTLLKLYWFIGGRHDIRAAFIGDSAGIARRVAGNLLPDFYVVTALALWLICVLFAGTPNSARWVFAAGSTQMALLALPILALGAHALVDDIGRHHQRNHGAGLATAMLASLRVVCAGLVWVGGLHIIASIWSPFMGGETSIAADWAFWLERLSLAVVGCWAVASFIWNYSEAIAPSPAILLPGHEDQNEKRQTSRLSTAMPVVRNLALGGVLAVGSLVILSALGVNVAPLLAGFGVLGLALSFGSQALVKDIVSGIFFIAEDAFRIGEYISTGNQQGTVEQIAIRSVRLRHHNGPVHTVPFGQINSVSNYSRDWGTIKFQLKFERDSDPELIRKTAKKVGTAMLDDPEFGADFLVPLKMQGIQDITENSIIVRFKFTSLPGNPSIIKREAIKRLISACKAAGLEFASNAVTVRSRGDGSHDDAAAASMLPSLTPIAAAGL
jgi:small-conductance mechanosensitive channel